MKSKLITRLAFFSLIMLGTFYFAPTANGQTNFKDDLRSTPTGNFVDVPTAIIRLDAALLVLKQNLANMNPHLPEYEIEDARYTYYDRIRTKLDDVKDLSGAQTAIAIGEATEALEFNTFDVDLKKIYKIKQDAITLLR